MKNKLDHNPDVLTCISNLSNDEVFTPPDFVNKILDQLPQEIFSDSSSTFLDPATKTGVFLREIAKRLIKGLEQEIPDLQERIDHIFQNQIFGLAISELTALMARRSIYCSKEASSEFSITNIFTSNDGNILEGQSNHFWKNEKCEICNANKNEKYGRDSDYESYAYEFIHNKNIGELFNKMKFDVIIGNPPYQLDTSGHGAQAKPIYHLFVEKALQLNPRYLSFVIPSRWFSGGMGLDKFRNEMINNRSLKKIIDYPKLYEIFPNEIKGGVCIFLFDTHHDGDCEFTTVIDGEVVSTATRDLRNNDGVIVRSNEAIPILEKILLKKDDSIIDFISAINPFDLPTNFRDFKNSKKDGYIKLYKRGGEAWVAKNQIKKGNDLLDLYKVLTPKAGDGHGRIPMKVTGEPIYAGKNSACTMTYIVAGAFNTKKEALNYQMYLSLKFVRFLISLRKSSMNVSKDVFKFVPKLDMNKSWSDDELYDLYELNKDEKSYIEENYLKM